MDKQLHDKMALDIDALRKIVSGMSTEEVVMWVVEIAGPMATEPRFDILSSPAKQCDYLLGLMVSTAEPEHPTKPTEQTWNQCIGLLQTIFATYADMFFPQDGDFASVPEEKTKQVELAMPVFLHYYNTKQTYLSVEQVTACIEGMLVPFDKELDQICGISASKALEITQWVSRECQQRLDSLYTIQSAHSLFNDRVTRLNWTIDQASAAAQADESFRAALGIFSRAENPFEMTHATLTEVHGDVSGQAYWHNYVATRGCSPTYTYPTEFNTAVEKPIFAIDSSTALLPVMNNVYTAVFDNMSRALTKSADANRFYKRRDQYLEDKAVEAFRRLFGEQAEFFPSAYESPKSQFEHDLIIIWQGFVFIIEAKASPPPEPWRDPAKTYTHMRDHFRGDRGIQKAYDQGNQIRQLLVSGQDIDLYDKSGTHLRTIAASETKKAYCICLTADNFGILASDLSLLLDKKAEEEFPWSTNIYDLEALVDAFAYLKWQPDRFCAYLDERAHLHGYVHTTDELEIAGIFITQGSLESIKPVDNQLVVLSHDMANVFDEIYKAQHGGSQVDLSSKRPIIVTDVNEKLHEMLEGNQQVPSSSLPVMPQSANRRRAGRNDPCPCGSGNKYKRCCGR